MGPADLGLDPDVLREAETVIRQNRPSILSFLVVRHGYIAIEGYYPSLDGADYQFSWRYLCQNVKSVTKSVLSALVGIALREGYLHDLDQSVVEFFPELHALEALRDAPELQLRHLLTMTTGLDWDEGGPVVMEMIRSQDWQRFVLGLPRRHGPGEHYNYSTGATVLLSAILTKATGESTLSLAERTLFEPLGIRDKLWQRDPQGYYLGGSELYLSARDLAKFGYLYLCKGVWDGHEIVPATWVRESTRKYQTTPDGLGYGYLWWVTEAAGHPVFEAGGFGGQRLQVVPDLDLVVVIQSRSDRPNAETPVDDILPKYVIPAVRG